MPRENSKFAGRFDKQILVYHIAGLDDKDISKSLNVSLKLVLSVLDTYNKMSSEDVRELHSIMGLEIPSQV
ncbi:hypothetical protein Ciccas_007175 [Cichlidogyrus casuarinus]|uniref:Uncharacterized protein n=1 Tax=Cichlidogyrus casuarinus TaxID=1844966 RepID=A0ABD2Q3L5_9PLAT